MVLPLRWPVDYRAYRTGETSFLTDRSVITVTPAPFAAGAAALILSSPCPAPCQRPSNYFNEELCTPLNTVVTPGQLVAAACAITRIDCSLINFLTRAPRVLFRPCSVPSPALPDSRLRILALCPSRHCRTHLALSPRKRLRRASD